MKDFKLRGQIYKAWSSMACSDPRPHAPHSWSSEYTVYGPYFCHGIHTECPCAKQCGHPIDYHFIRAHADGAVQMCIQCHLDQKAQLQAEAARSPWVPCSDVLPPVNGTYLWRRINGTVTVERFSTFVPGYSSFRSKYVAWMPIPEYVEPSPERSSQEARADERIDG